MSFEPTEDVKRAAICRFLRVGSHWSNAIHAEQLLSMLKFPQTESSENLQYIKYIKYIMQYTKCPLAWTQTRQMMILHHVKVFSESLGVHADSSTSLRCGSWCEIKKAHQLILRISNISVLFFITIRILWSIQSIHMFLRWYVSIVYCQLLLSVYNIYIYIYIYIYIIYTCMLYTYTYGTLIYAYYIYIT